MADFQTHLGELEELGVSVYALSTDTAEQAGETVDKESLTFPVLYGLDGPGTAETLGAFYEERRNIIQPVGFLLGPNRNIVSMTISNAQLGRLWSDDVLRMVKFFQRTAQQK